MAGIVVGVDPSHSGAAVDEARAPAGFALPQLGSTNTQYAGQFSCPAVVRQA